MASSLAILLLLLRFSGAIAISSSYITRSTEQQIIATVAPAAFADADASQSAAQPFLTSPSGSYAAYLRRAVDSGSPGGAAGGGDVCYVEIVQQQADGSGSSVWESDCTPVGGADTCDLAFSPMGLELFAGGHSLWDTGVDADPGMLSLDGAGDMRVVSKDGVTVWRASGEPWTGQRCGAALPVSASPSTDVLAPPSATSAKLLTPPATSLAGPWGTNFTFGDQTAPPVDTSTDLPLPPPPTDASTDSPDLPLPPPPPADPSTDSPDLPLPPPPTDASTDSPDLPLPPPPPADPSTDSPDLPLPPPPTDASTDSPDLPLPPPPADTYPIPESPDQPLYSSPPPVPTAFGPQTPSPPPDTPPLVPPTGSGVAGVTSPGAPSAGIATPPGSSGDDMAFPPPPVGIPHPHGPPHQLPLGASPALAPGGHGAGAGLPLGQGQQQRGQGQGVFGQQQNQLLNGGGQPREDSSGGWSSSEHGGAAVSLALVGLMALAFRF